MKGYIIIKKRTAIAFSLAALLIAATAAWWMYSSVSSRKTADRYVETRSYNVLQADGRNLLYFSDITGDSTFFNAAFSASGIMHGRRISIDGERLHAIIGNYKAKLQERKRQLDAAGHETEYFLNTHNVQDEGFGMIALHHEDIGREKGFIDRQLRMLDGIHESSSIRIVHKTQWRKLTETPPSGVFIECSGGMWQNGHWQKGMRRGTGIAEDPEGRLVCGTWNADTLQDGWRTDSNGVYRGQFNRYRLADGHGSYTATDGTYYEGRWRNGRRDGFGFEISRSGLRAGEWKDGIYKGERISYTSERIYGIDISRYQHGKGRKYYPIYWNRLRITNLGHLSKKNISGTVDYPVTFIYIKSTEGTSIRNRYYKADYAQAQKHGLHCGAYHFFSTKTSGAAQARFFIRNTCFRKGDFPPVLDVEPTHSQIMRMGGPEAMFNSIRAWMRTVERHTGVKPILYINQTFVNKYLNLAPDIKKNYNVWIARYGEYKPDVKLVYWQLSPDGRVNGIHGDVDINVFNGYQDVFESFINTQSIR